MCLSMATAKGMLLIPVAFLMPESTDPKYVQCKSHLFRAVCPDHSLHRSVDADALTNANLVPESEQLCR